MNDSFKIAFSGFEPALEPLSFSGREAMNTTYRFDVEIAVTRPDADACRAELLRRAATVAFPTPAGERRVHGVVDRIRIGSSLADGRVVVGLRLIPHLELLRQGKHTRIFQDMTTREIVERIARQAGVEPAFDLAAKLSPRPYTCQYRETDLRFVHRLLAEDGLFYWFDHSGSTETWRVADEASAYPMIDGGPRLVVAPPDADSGLRLEEHHVTRFAWEAHGRPERVFRAGRDIARPHARVTDDAAIDGTRLAVADAGAPAEYILPAGALANGVYTHIDHRGSAEETRSLGLSAGRHLESLRRRSVRGAGRSVCRRLEPGRRAQIDADWGELDVLIVGVRHWMRSATRAGQAQYESAFEVAPARTPMRPDMRSARLTAGLETATVVGPAGAETHTDPMGRVRLRFHWDVEAPSDDHASAWVRVSQAWAGASFGVQFLPRVGMEVLVDFVGGDPDRPIVVGTAHNGAAPPPFALPEDAHKSGIRTRSTPGTRGGHELVFDDAADAQCLSLHSSRALDIASQGGTVLHAGGEVRITSGGDRSDTTGGVQITRVESDLAVSVGRNHTLAIENDEQRMVGGVRNTSVASHDQLRVGGARVELITGMRNVVVGTAADSPADDRLTVTGKLIQAANGDVSITSAKVIHLRCGDSVLSLHPDRIVLDAPRLQLQGDDRIVLAQGRGPDATLTLEGEARLGGRTVRVASEDGANLELGPNADLRGARVSLGTDPANVTGSREVSDEPGVARIRVLPEWFPPGVSEVTLQIASPTGEILERTSAPGQILDLDGRKGEAFTVLGMKVGDQFLPIRARGVPNSSEA
ncbi:MAG: type VI secretion system tip protein TssI/VgrG [Polyangiaceae bacterium]